ncbi:UNVERIFIED_ORG: flagellar hook-associated protein 3 [Bacillus sp. AZ43]
MRITQKAVTLTSLQGLNGNLANLAKLQNQLTSGKVINRPSDSPTGTNKAMQTRSEQATLAQYTRNVSDAKGWLEQGGSTMLQMMDMTQRIRDLTVQGLNGATSPASQQALATEVASLRDGLINLANTRVAGRPLFGGVTAGDKAYDATGAYVGSPTGEITRRVSDSELLRVDLTGPEAFGTGAASLFSVVGDIAADMVGNTGDLDTDLANLDVALRTMQGAVADLGARAARLERLETVNADRTLTLTTQLSAAEEIDLPNTIMRLSMQETGYQAALAATAKVISPTLLDFLR